MKEKLQDIKEENIVIFIYFILLYIYLYANKIEVEYLKYNKESDKENYRILLFIVFGISFIITLYYTIESVKDVKTSKTNEIYNLKTIETIANILILVATALYLYIIYKDKNIDVEVSL